MEGFGERLRLRAIELGLTGAEVARRAGLSPIRYGHYLTGYREPDLTTLVRICRVLALRPDKVLAFEPLEGEPDAQSRKRAEITDIVATMDTHFLKLTWALIRTIAVAANRGRSPANRRLPKTRTSAQMERKPTKND